jgi:deoxycytidylate deaminase
VLVAAGIKAIKYHFDYKNDELVFELLNQWKIPIEKL